ncbi:hypothetical protein X777_06938 [Ooceraea biroi]|uniref:Reverse transcriptase domain-containing protein n=1 Tax=Ooceraea biroi TaxID=2015173 RepID=A0A026WBX2_OOCBI|nr:hypothetical protein X777_06938 [Ooceraea biroi]
MVMEDMYEDMERRRMAERIERGGYSTNSKKGNGDRMEDYRRITLTQTAYRVYAAILAERLKEEMEAKRMLPSSQTGFKRGMGTIDNIYVLNYLINRQISKKKARIVIMFLDLKAAFDSVDRGILIETKRGKRGFNEEM